MVNTLRIMVSGAGLCLLTACANAPEYATSKRGIAVAKIPAAVETTPVASDDDAADDAAIWVHTENGALSRVLGTDKQKGLLVYDLQGNEKQFIAAGRLNNVDLRQSLVFGQETKDIAIATNRTDNSLDVFEIATDGKVRRIGQQPLDLTEPYGSCMYRDHDGNAYAFANDKDGRYQQWRLNSLTPVSLTKVREFRLASQPEGCAADDATGRLYVGEENFGLWQFPADPNDTAKRELIDQVGKGVLVADIEGMDIYRVNASLAYLLVSSQGDNSYAVYEVSDSTRYKGSFRIVDNDATGVDGSEETDGLSVSHHRLGEEFAHGMIVVQDGFNRSPTEAQNFKYITWERLAQALGLESISAQ